MLWGSPQSPSTSRDRGAPTPCGESQFPLGHTSHGVLASPAVMMSLWRGALVTQLSGPFLDRYETLPFAAQPSE